jgi:hypothetical protein
VCVAVVAALVPGCRAALCCGWCKVVLQCFILTGVLSQHC